MAKDNIGALLNLCLSRIHIEETTMNTEQEFLAILQSFEAVRKRWLACEADLKRFKELLVKSDVAKAALEVKLKHARNQLDIEMKKRFKVEGDYHYLQRQMQLMCDILVNDSKSTSCLNDEQKNLLAAFEQKNANVTRNKRRSVIDESSFLSHSDISYDRTDDDLDLNTSIKPLPLRSRARERRRSSMGPVCFSASLANANNLRRGRSGNVTELEKHIEEEVETSDTEEQIDLEQVVQIHDTHSQEPDSQENLQVQDRPRPQDCAADQTSVWSPSEETLQKEEEEKTQKHIFVSKTVILTETCLSCSKRIRFGKVAFKCRNCRAMFHPECKHSPSDRCSPVAMTTALPVSVPAATTLPTLLEGFAPLNPPRIPSVITECVTEIEKRGLQERGLYRVPGSERLIRELRSRLVQNKPLCLSKVTDVHVVSGFLKDFLRKLAEPIVTFKLHKSFMQAAEMPDEGHSLSLLYKAVTELPRTNRDSLSFLMLHLHRVKRSPACQMDQNNLSRVFGPTLVGHELPEPSPSTIMRDTQTQPKVVGRLFSFPESTWRRFLDVQTELTSVMSASNANHNANTNANPSCTTTTLTSTKTSRTELTTNANTGTTSRWFSPLTSPELQNYRQNRAARGRYTGTTRYSGSGSEPVRRFFTSPS